MPFQRISRSRSRGPEPPAAASRSARPKLEAPAPQPTGPPTGEFWSQWMDRASRFGHHLAGGPESAPIQTMPAAGPVGEAAAPRENRTGLPDDLKAGVESLSGVSLDDVKVHYNSPKPAGLEALAYTQGTAIHVAPGQEEHLAHEAWHVVQQKQGRVRPTMQLKQARINDDPGLEKEAEVMGNRALK